MARRVVLDGYLLDCRIRLAGRCFADLGRPPLNLSKPVRAALRNGRPVSSGTLLRLNAWLEANPVLPELAALLADEEVQKNGTVNGKQPLTVTKEAKVGNAVRRSQA